VKKRETGTNAKHIFERKQMRTARIIALEFTSS